MATVQVQSATTALPKKSPEEQVNELHGTNKDEVVVPTFESPAEEPTKEKTTADAVVEEPVKQEAKALPEFETKEPTGEAKPTGAEEPKEEAATEEPAKQEVEAYVATQEPVKQEIEALLESETKEAGEEANPIGGEPKEATTGDVVGEEPAKEVVETEVDEITAAVVAVELKETKEEQEAPPPAIKEEATGEVPVEKSEE